jgi:hypothetical protein
LPTGSKRVIRRPPAPASEYEEEAPRRRPREEEPEDDRPRRTRRDAEGSGSSGSGERRRRPSIDDDEYLVTSGWGGKKRVIDEMPSDFAPTFSVTEDRTIIKFLQEGPAANFKQHWCDWIEEGKRAFLCRKVECPLCEIGHKPSARFAFNILDFTDPENPRNAVLIVGIKVANVIEAKAKDRVTSPLNNPNIYYAISKTSDKKGSARRRGGTTQTNLEPVKARDLAEDYDIDPLTKDEHEKWSDGCFDREMIIQPSTLDDLEKAADSYGGE